MYLRSDIKYTRRIELEGINMHLTILDIMANEPLRLININRSFNPPNGMPQREMFRLQLERIRAAYTTRTIVMGDFILDINRIDDMNYAFKNYFDDMNLAFSDLILEQLITFPTWTRVVNGTTRESILDHVYSSDPTSIANISSACPVFGDHLLLVVTMNMVKTKQIPTWRRNWHQYSKETLCYRLSTVDWRSECGTVQDYWNEFENKLLNVIEELITLCKDTLSTSCPVASPVIKNM
jgi:hypothetical protein